MKYNQLLMDRYYLSLQMIKLICIYSFQLNCSLILMKSIHSDGYMLNHNHKIFILI